MKNTKHQNNNSDYSLGHVLYQKLGADWYAFTELDGDCYMSKVDAKEAEAKAKKDTPVFPQRKTPRAA